MPVHTKQVIKHINLYIVAFTKEKELPCIIFIHGGPGLNCGVLEYLIEHEGIFDSLQFDIVLYDQRGCGRSEPTDKTILHSDNIHDLEEVCRTIKEDQHYDIAAIAGHSYGAKLLFDYFQYKQTIIPGIFISIASSILTPRINNLLFDLSYLKNVDKEQYQAILKEFDEFNYEKLWDLTERLAKVFQENKNRPYFYWANLVWQEKVKKIQDEIKLPTNTEVFTSVRKDLYSKPEEFSVDIRSISSAPCLWVNGLHDLIMNGASALSEKAATCLFFKSAHYPHIEEYEKFCGEVNSFLKNS